MKKILIIGASGFLGRKLNTKLSKSYSVVGTYTSHKSDDLIYLDPTNPEEVKKMISELKPDVVIHAAGNPDLDYCEKNPKEADLMHHLSVKYAVDACKKNGAKLIYVSSTYVFSGDHAPYHEVDPLGEPINEYGKAKGKAEQEVKTLPNSAILRFDFLYGYNGPNKPNGLVNKITSGNPVEATNEQQRKPLLVDDVAIAVDRIIEVDGRGVYHLAGPDSVSKYDLTVALAKEIGLTADIRPISEAMQAVKQIARRPKDTSLVTNRLGELGMTCTPIKQALSIIKEQFISQNVEGRRFNIEQ